MSITSGSSVLWSDIQNLYTQLNSIKTTHGIATTTVPSNPGLTKPSVVTDLKSLIDALSAERHIGSQATVSPAIPKAGEAMRPAPFTTIQDKLTALTGICHNDTGNFGFGFSTNDGFGFSTNDGFGFSTRDSFRFSGDRGFSFSGRFSFGFSSRDGFSFSSNDGFSFSGDRGFSFSGDRGFSFSGDRGFGFSKRDGFGFTALNFGAGNSSVRQSFCTRNFTF